MDAGLADKIVLVTGGSRGIGRALGELLAAPGADVTSSCRDTATPAAEGVSAARAAGRKVAAEKVDIRDSAASAAAVDRLAERGGTIDILLNNAGAIRDNQLAAFDDEDVRVVLDTNVGGVFNVTRAVVPHMIVRRRGQI